MEQSAGSQRIVVGVDGTPDSDAALSWAATEAMLRQAKLEVAHAWNVPHGIGPTGMPEWPADDEPFRIPAERTVADAVARLPDAVDATHVAAEGHPSAVLVHAAAGADLLVVGTGRHRTHLLGSTADHVVHAAPCPVAVVPPDCRPGTVDARVVVGVDGSDASYEALLWAIDDAARRSAALSVVHTWRSVADVVRAEPLMLERAAHTLAAHMVQGALSSAPQQPASVEVTVFEGAPGPGILGVADGASVVVVGSRGRGGFASLLLGSVSRHCAHNARCPTVIVRPCVA